MIYFIRQVLMSPTEPVVCKKHLRRLQGNGYIRAILLYVNYPPYLPKISGESNEFYSALSLDIGEFIVSMIVSLA